MSLRLNGSRIPNHGYVDLSTVDNDRDTVQCHTDLTTCCVQEVGSEGGDWYAPNGNVLPTTGAAITQQPTYHRIDLFHHGSGGVSGIYHCSIAASAESIETMYVGLYSSGGEGRTSGEVLCMWDSIPVEVRVGLVERYYVCGTLFQWR